MNKATIATAMGNIIEWYEYGVYSYIAGIIGAQFFPEGNTTTALLFGFAIFAISFFFRPLGGIIFGLIGDRLGRKKILIITILMMSLSTAFIGLLPTYNTIGILAPVLLIIFRIIQGVATGGGYIGAQVYMNEVAPNNKRAFFTSLLESGSMIGYIIGAAFIALLSSVLSQAELTSWGWRIPLLCSLPLALVGVWLRKTLEDSPTYLKMKKENNIAKNPLKEMFKTSKKPLLVTFLCITFANGAYYALLTYLPSYFETQVGLNTNQSLVVTTLGMLVMVFLMPVYGTLSDRFGKKLFLLLSTSLVVIIAIPIFKYVSSGASAGPMVGFFALSIVCSMFFGVYSSVLPIQFPSRVRNSAYGISYNISTAIFGGGGPFIITALTAATGSKMMPAYYLIGTALIAIVGVLCLPAFKVQSNNRQEAPTTYPNNEIVEKV